MSLSKNDIKKRLGINNWLDLDNADKFGDYLRLYPHIRKGIHLTIIADLPNYPVLVHNFITTEINQGETNTANVEKLNMLASTVEYLSEAMNKDSLTAREQQELVDHIGTALALVKSLKKDLKLPAKKPIALNIGKLQPTMVKLRPSMGKLQKSVDIVKNAFLSVGAVILIIGAFIFRIKLTEEVED